MFNSKKFAYVCALIAVVMAVLVIVSLFVAPHAPIGLVSGAV